MSANGDLNPASRACVDAAVKDAPRMRDFTLYSVATDGALRLAVTFSAPSVLEAIELAQAEAADLGTVEIWEGVVCIYRHARGARGERA